jgi:predicted AAA+ superfamily ATPase
MGRLAIPAPFRRADAIDMIARGGFPEIRPLADTDRMARYASYVNSIVERDVAPVAQVRRPDVLRRMGDQLLSFGPGRVALPLSILWSFPR